ncbi:MAG: biotin--[acetyl-CoA-carboxylase] ligase [Endomicrobiales bacterium]|nr:biotin--[acetyl-CoA-carboxylase] ligase [Endomicrobiales bacterium]
MNILNVLSRNKRISGEKIAEILKITRAAVHKQVNRLRKQGYNISGHKNSGYSLVENPNLLIPNEIKLNLHNPAHLKEIVYKDKINSTQLLAKELAARGKPEWTLVVCEEQTQGYGRINRKWFSPKGGIWFSLILRPDILPEKVPQITLAISISICRVFKKYKIDPFIKWPNDIVVDNRKVVGILTEMSAEIGRVNWVIAGVGINANNEIPGEVKDTALSLKKISGYEVNRARLLADIVSDFHNVYKELCSKGFSLFSAEYNKYSNLIGKDVKVDSGDRVIIGKVKEIDSDGYLWIKHSKGLEKIIAADVTLSGGAKDG